MAQIDYASEEIRLLPVGAKNPTGGGWIDLSGDTVEVALIAANLRPADGDWIECEWSEDWAPTSTNDPPGAVALLLNLGDPGSTGWDLSTLGNGDFYPWVRVHRSPELPIITSLSPLRVSGMPSS